MSRTKRQPTGQRRREAAGVVERRRSRRRHLHDAIEVSLRGAGEAERWHSKAVMLNASEDGLACRVLGSDADGLSVDRRLRAVFRIHPGTEPFDLFARITNLTAGGTPGTMVLGLELLFDGDLGHERARLSEALAAACGRED